MKTVLLAGGMGTRISEESEIRPKPMIEVGGRPIMWHIMSIYAAHGFSDFVAALGYKSEIIKQYFLHFHHLNSDIKVKIETGTVQVLGHQTPNWNIELVETGFATQTGGRLNRLRPYLQDGTFMMTYGDGVSDVDLKSLVEFHKSHGKLVTVTAVRPPSRFGNLQFHGTTDEIINFSEKRQGSEGWINGGFFVLEPGVFDYLCGDEVPFETEPLSRLAQDGQLVGFRHHGFFQPMDTLRDKRYLEELWHTGKAPWKVWK